MAEDLYEDSAGEPVVTPDAPDAEAAETETAILPKAFFAGKELEPGSECKIRIAQVHDDSVEVEYVSEHTEPVEQELEMGEEPPLPDGMEELMA